MRANMEIERKRKGNIMAEKRNENTQAAPQDERMQTVTKRLPDGHGGEEGETIYDNLQERQAHRQPETERAAERDRNEFSGNDQTRPHGNRPKVSRQSREDHN